MKRFVTVATLSLLGAASQAADVGVSVSVSQPGVYGRIDIGRFPQPVVINPQPVIIAQPAVVVAQPVHPVQPVYLWVPPGHQKHWHKHCYRYNACGVPVHFVQEQWYQQHVMVAQSDHGHDKGHGKGHGRKHKHDD